MTLCASDLCLCLFLWALMMMLMRTSDPVCLWSPAWLICGGGVGRGDTARKSSLSLMRRRMMMMGQTEEGVLENLFLNLCAEPLFSFSAKNTLYFFQLQENLQETNLCPTSLCWVLTLTFPPFSPAHKLGRPAPCSPQSLLPTVVEVSIGHSLESPFFPTPV